MPLTGRPYQERAADWVARAWREGKCSPLLVSPVGSGKTHIGLLLIERALAKGVCDIWWLAHRRELIEQPANRLQDAEIEHEVLMAGMPKRHLGASVRVASVQTVIRRPIEARHRTALVFIDEAHRASARSYREGILARLRVAYERVYLVLLTATPYRLDGKPLSEVADSLYEVASPRELITDGYICEPRVYGGAAPDMDGVRLRRQGELIDFDQKEAAERVNKGKLIADIVDSWKKLAEGRPSIGFALSIAHSLRLTERFRDAGIRAAHIDGTTPKDIRSQILARLAIGGQESGHPEALDIVFNVGILGEGWDSESDYRRVLEDKSLWLGKSYPPEYQPLCVMVDAAPTESMCMYRQREGRVTRTHARKPWARVLCHSDNWRRHGPLVAHEGFTLEEPLLFKRRALAPGVILPASTQCPACLAVFLSGPSECPYCGSLLRKERQPTEKAGELTEVDFGSNPQRPATPREEDVVLAEYMYAWITENEQRARDGRSLVKPGQPKVRFSKRYGRWPRLDQLKRAEAAARELMRREKK